MRFLSINCWLSMHSPKCGQLKQPFCGKRMPLCEGNWPDSSVEETLVAGASVSKVARRHDVNANQVFYWRKLYREGQLGGDRTTQLLPVRVRDDRTARAVGGDGFGGAVG